MDSVPVIYVTGFGPFGSHTENISQRIVESLATSNIEQELNVKLHTEILDVAYDSVLEKVPGKWHDLQPKLVIHIGVSDLADAITLETKSFNENYIRPDVRQSIPGSLKCLQGFPSCLSTKLDLEKTVKEMEKEGPSGLKYIISTDPGKYLCGFVYYLSLAISERRSLFVHVPALKVFEDQNAALARLVSAMATLIKCLYRQLQERDKIEQENPKVECVLQTLKQQPRPR